MSGRSGQLEVSEVIGVGDDAYTEYVPWRSLIDHMTPDLAAMAGVSRRNLSYLKTKTESKEPLSLRQKTKKALLK